MSVEARRLQRMRTQLQSLKPVGEAAKDLLEEIEKIPAPASSNPVLDGLHFPSIQLQGWSKNFLQARVDPEDHREMGTFTDRFLDLPSSLRRTLGTVETRLRQIPATREFATVKAKTLELVSQMKAAIQALEVGRMASSTERIIRLHLEKQAAVKHPNDPNTPGDALGGSPARPPTGTIRLRPKEIQTGEDGYTVVVRPRKPKGGFWVMQVRIQDQKAIGTALIAETKEDVPEAIRMVLRDMNKFQGVGGDLAWSGRHRDKRVRK